MPIELDLEIVVIPDPLDNRALGVGAMIKGHVFKEALGSCRGIRLQVIEELAIPIPIRDEGSLGGLNGEGKPVFVGMLEVNHMR